MEESNDEKVAQLLYENVKLQDELKLLKRHALSLEENYNLLFLTSSQRDNHIKSLEQQVNWMCESLREKEQFIEALELDNEKFTNSNKKLMLEQSSLKKELIEEQEGFKIKEEETRNAYDKIKEENARLMSEISIRSEELFLSNSIVSNLEQKVKELENENLELLILKDNLIHRISEEQAKKVEDMKTLLAKSQDWVTDKSEMAFLDHDVPFAKRCQNLNLREEILQVEVEEKEVLICELKESLLKKEEEISRHNQLVTELKEKLEKAGLLIEDWKSEFSFHSSPLNDVYKHLLKLINWPEGQSGEIKPLTEVPSLAIVVKDGVETSQPGSIWVVETITIASQTDPVRNLSPVLGFKSSEKCQSTETNSLSDSDEEVRSRSASLLEETEAEKNRPIFSDHRNSDLDMDIYRSCRKLSVLPEEDVEDSLIRKTSFKNYFDSQSNSFRLKTHSADDVYKIGKIQASVRETSSSLSLILDGLDSRNSHFPRYGNVDDDVGTDDVNEKSNPDMRCRKSEFALFALESSFVESDSLDGKLNSFPALEPIRGASFDFPIGQKSRSTCRPLRLPCEMEDKKKDDRVCKVRFDLSGMTSYDAGHSKISNGKEKKSAKFPSSLKSSKNIKIVSRFKVEIVDEVEFRKSLEKDDNVLGARKRPLLTPPLPEDSFNESASEHASLPDEFSKDEMSVSENGRNEDFRPSKRRKQSDEFEINEGRRCDGKEHEILIRSIKLHANSGCLVMKEVSRSSSESSESTADFDFPYIDAEEMPVLKPSSESRKSSPVENQSHAGSRNVTLPPRNPVCTETNYLTSGDSGAATSEESFKRFGIGSSKFGGLSKSPTVFKNLANFELLTAIFKFNLGKNLPRGTLGREELETVKEAKEFLPRSWENFKSPPSDASDEASESDLQTYSTVKSHLLQSSDCDSDTYVTVWSDRSSILERKFSDLSENSSSTYNTPPETGSDGFCTPPDNYSPISNLPKRNSGSSISFGSPVRTSPMKIKNFPVCSSTSVVAGQEPDGKSSQNGALSDWEYFENRRVAFDSPKSEFRETNDSAKNLETFLSTERSSTGSNISGSLKKEKSLSDSNCFEEDEDGNRTKSTLKRNSLEGPSDFRLIETCGRRHLTTSRQTSAEEYNFLDLCDSCLNSSEEVSSPSTTPDTSNKTVIFRRIPLTVSNTIDSDDALDYFPEAEIRIDSGETRTEVSPGVADVGNQGNQCCRSEPCTPSASSSMEFSSLLLVKQQRSSCGDEAAAFSTPTLKPIVSAPPEIIISNFSLDFDNIENVDFPRCEFPDFTSNISDRSEIHLSDVESLSDRCESDSEHSNNNNLVSDSVFASEGKSTDVSPEVSENSDEILPMEKTADGLPEEGNRLSADSCHEGNEEALNVASGDSTFRVSSANVEEASD